MTWYTHAHRKTFRQACEQLGLDPERVQTLRVNYGWDPDEPAVVVEARILVDRDTLIALAELTVPVEGSS